ncbi:MAG TPA: DinB family protein [Candidatus Angelobacter sp.]|nr:DinB family protein [Candidatus Angelobacter sp.]
MKISWEKVNQDLEDIRRQTRKLINGLSPEQLTRRPDPGKWSIAECLVHLNLTATNFQKLIGSAIRRGKADKIVGQGPFKAGGVGRLLIWIAEPPPKFKIKAPAKILPPANIGDPSVVIAEFLRAQDEWARLVREADGLDLNKIKAKTGFPGLPPMRLGATIPWMMAHQRRHLLQAEEVKQRVCN